MKTYKNFLFLTILFLIVPVYETRGSQNLIDPSNTGTFIENKSVLGIGTAVSIIILWTVYKKWFAKKNTPPQANNAPNTSHYYQIPDDAVIIQEKATGKTYAVHRDAFNPTVDETYENNNSQSQQSNSGLKGSHSEKFKLRNLEGGDIPDDANYEAIKMSYYSEEDINPPTEINRSTFIQLYNYEQDVNVFIDFLKSHKNSLEKNSVDSSVDKLCNILSTCSQPPLIVYNLYKFENETLHVVGTIVATAVKPQFLWNKTEYGTINFLYTDEKYSNKRFDLIDTIMHECKKRNFKSLYCPVSTKDKDTIELMKKNGWTDSKNHTEMRSKEDMMETMRLDLLSANNDRSAKK